MEFGMKKALLLPCLLLATALLLGILGCRAEMVNTETTTTETPVALNVSAAASLKDALTEINSLYVSYLPHVTITPNFASSGILQKQIEQGAPADLFISAGVKQMDALQTAQLILDNTRCNLLTNRLVLVVPAESPLDITGFNDLTNDIVKQIAVGDPASVPAGTYARQAFDILGIAAQVEPKLILGCDVRHVLAYIESGNVDAGIVYSTDALLSDKVKIVSFAPDKIDIVYPVAVIKACPNTNAAEDYLGFLFGTEAKVLFEKYGFVAATN